MTILTINHAKLASEVAKHIAADAVVQGEYWNGTHGCFIGCLAHSSNASFLEREYGLPEPLVRICENIFEELAPDHAKAFFAAIPDAVGRDGKDLSRVHWAFLASELRALPKVPDDIQAVIDPVISGMDLLAAGGKWSADAARADAIAAYAARAAADAARAAAIAAYAAADAYAAARAAADAARAAAIAAYAYAYAYAAADAYAAARAAADAARAAAIAAYAYAYAEADAAIAAYAAARKRQRDTILNLIKAA
jgi:hypothetical protein